METTTKRYAAVKRAKKLAMIVLDDFRSADNIIKIENSIRRSRSLAQVMFTDVIERRQFWLELQVRVNALLVSIRNETPSDQDVSAEKGQRITNMEQAFSLIWHELYE